MGNKRIIDIITCYTICNQLECDTFLCQNERYTTCKLQILKLENSLMKAL